MEMRRCYRCHALTIQSSTTTKIFALTKPVIIEEMPCFLCPGCGAVSFSGEMLMAIGEVLQKYQSEDTVRFSDIAAEVSQVNVGKVILQEIKSS